MLIFCTAVDTESSNHNSFGLHYQVLGLISGTIAASEAA